MNILVTIVIGWAAAMLVVLLFPRWLCLALGAVLLILGIAVPACLWTYAAWFVRGDQSGFGMLGTICVILFAPAGLALTVVGFFKSG